jgi:thiol:disulfide interchange protein DsbA
MNCEDIDSILDRHRIATLTAAERSNVDAHLAGCERCADQWSADQALASESFSGPRPGLLADIVGVAGIADMRPPPRRTTAPWVTAAGAVAVVALVVVAWWSPPLRRTEAPVAANASARANPSAADTPARVDRFREGVHYTLLASTAPQADSGVNEIEIEEFFIYGCRHCYVFETELERWRATLPSDVKLVRVPAMFGPAARLHAQAFYTAAALGKGELHAAIYEEIHSNGNSLDSETALEALFGRFGVDGTTFRATFESPAVEAEVLRAEALSHEYRIAAAPSLVVDHKFLTSPGLAGSPEATLAILDELVAKARGAAATDQDGAPRRSSNRSQ